MSQLLPLLLCAVVGCSLQGAAGQSTNVEGQVAADKDTLKDDVAFLVNSIRTMVQNQQKQVIKEGISTHTLKQQILDINATLHNLKHVMDKNVEEDYHRCLLPRFGPHHRRRHPPPPPPPRGRHPPPPTPPQKSGPATSLPSHHLVQPMFNGDPPPSHKSDPVPKQPPAGDNSGNSRSWGLI
ncbi:uncharacterized protein [Haliotis cracherodii]|uniref:uncharacterized protein n=1 Tax=Haliotis cracherodii TaxID=6455 RepID=UPI0039ED03AE